MTDKFFIFLIAVFGLVMLIVLTQPAWRGEEMLIEFRADCDKRGGVFLEHQKTFGTEYQCASRLD